MFGPLGMHAAIDRLIDEMKETDTLRAAIRVNHFGRFFPYGERLADAGFMAVAFANAIGLPLVSAGGKRARMGTNPIMIACPRGLGKSCVADMTLAACTEGEISYAKEAGAELPAGFLFDSCGNESRDPNDLYTEPRGAIANLGGKNGWHRAMALSLMFELLAGGLSDVFSMDAEGADITSRDEAKIPRGVNGTLLWITRPFGSCEEKRSHLFQRIEEYLSYVLDTEPRPDNAAGDDGPQIWLPESRELYQREKNLAAGVEFSESTWKGIKSEAAQIPVNLEDIVPSRKPLNE